MHVLEINQKDYDDTIAYGGEGKTDAAFRKINKNSIGFHLWKVENDHVEVVPKSQFGIFNENYAYIVYAASPKGSFVDQETITREMKNAGNIEYCIHFWLGEKASPDCSGNAAYKLIDLDMHLGRNTVQFREFQGNESMRFLSYFKSGLTILCENNPSTIRLFHVRGKKSPLCIQKSAVEWVFFSSGAVMLLQTEPFMFVWIGRSSSASERQNGLRIAQKLLTDSASAGEIVIVDDGYEQSMADERKCVWNKYLNLADRIVHPLNGTAANGSAVPSSALKLYKCGYAGNKYRVEEIKTARVVQEDLNCSEVAFIVDGGSERGVWIWVGKSATTAEKSEAMRNARGFVKKKKYSRTTPVARTIEGSEPMEFIDLFPAWATVDQISNKSANLMGKLDLRQRPRMAADLQLIDDGNGNFIVYKVANMDLAELPKRANMALFSGNCFIIDYCIPFDTNIMAGSQVQQHVLYLWTGRQCSPADKTCGESFLDAICDQIGSTAMRVRVAEGSEPPHFLQIFKGNLIVFNGLGNNESTQKLPPNMNGTPSASLTLFPSSYVLRVFGNTTFNSKAVQLLSVASFSSQECYILKTIDQELWVWCGHTSTGDSKEIAKSIGSSIGDYTLILESNEPAEFWDSISDKMAEKIRAARDSRFALDHKTPDAARKGALYVCSPNSTTAPFKQLMAYEQKDLAPEDIYLFDAGSMVYIWIGSLSSMEEGKLSWKIGIDFINQSSMRRDTQTAVAVIKQSFEPNTFIGFFNAWDPKCWDNYQSFDMVRLRSGSTSPTAYYSRSNSSDAHDDHEFDRYEKYPIEILRGEASTLPEAIDPKRKEIHLTHDDFNAVFNMHFSEFKTLPNWKRQELKKIHKLF